MRVYLVGGAVRDELLGRPVHERDWVVVGATPAELEAYLASPTGDDPEDIRRMKTYLDSLKKRLAEPHKSCRLVSSTNSTVIPFAMMMRDATHIRAFGLDVKLNDHNMLSDQNRNSTGWENASSKPDVFPKFRRGASEVRGKSMGILGCRSSGENRDEHKTCGRV